MSHARPARDSRVNCDVYAAAGRRGGWLIVVGGGTVPATTYDNGATSRTGSRLGQSPEIDDRSGLSAIRVH